MCSKIVIENLNCLCSSIISKDRIAYILYPIDMLQDWIEVTAKKHHITIVVITGMDWQNVFSPWPARGVPKGDPDFKGESPQFLQCLQRKVIPYIETSLNINDNPERSLIGVSMSGLFALWQWMICDTFTNIASLSGSFWYEGFLSWIKQQSIPQKSDEGYFLLGDKESNAKTFSTVGTNTQEVVSILKSAGIKVEYQIVPGNHYSNPISRLNKAFSALFPEIHQ